MPSTIFESGRNINGVNPVFQAENQCICLLEVLWVTSGKKQKGDIWKSPLAPLCQRGVIPPFGKPVLSLSKEGCQEGFYKSMPVSVLENFGHHFHFKCGIITRDPKFTITGNLPCVVLNRLHEEKTSRFISASLISRRWHWRSHNPPEPLYSTPMGICNQQHIPSFRVWLLVQDS